MNSQASSRVMPGTGSAADSLDVTNLTSWKTPIAFVSITVLYALLVFLAPRHGDVVFQVSPMGDSWQVDPMVWNSDVVSFVASALLLALSLTATALVRLGRRVPIWVIAVFAAIVFMGFLTWAAAGADVPIIPLPGLLAGSVSLATPLVFGALTGVIGERVGVVNIAIEGQMLFGAFTSAIVSTVTGNPFVGLISAMVAGVLVGMVLSVFSVKYFVDQVIVGVVLNVLVIGLTGFLFSELLAPFRPELNTPVRFERIFIPLLSDIPLIGPMFFRHTIIVYLMYITVALVAWGLYKTRWGLRLRAVGEHPQAADTVGIKVNRMRFWNVSGAGAIAGVGGAFFTLGSVGAFNKEMTAGAGFIALAAVIFGQWDPMKAALAALLFGFASNIQNTLGVIGSPVPSEFMLMLPYVVTIFAVAGLVGKVRAPAATGKPYIK